MKHGFPRMPERFSSQNGKSGKRARVVAFGDSLTAGWSHGCFELQLLFSLFSSLSGRYCKGSKFEPYAKALLKALPPQIAVDIFVCGLSGFTAGQM
eukprot:4616438-Amphidinium_carterae.1